MIRFVRDAAQHRLLGAARQGLDGDAQALGGVSRSASHPTNGRATWMLGKPRHAPEADLAAPGRCSERCARRVLVAAFGDAGHAFPAIALARALARRGHEVLVETWERWREAVEAEGLGFTAAQEYTVVPAAGARTGGGRPGARMRRGRCCR